MLMSHEICTREIILIDKCSAFRIMPFNISPNVSAYPQLYRLLVKKSFKQQGYQLFCIRP